MCKSQEEINISPFYDPFSSSSNETPLAEPRKSLFTTPANKPREAIEGEQRKIRILQVIADLDRLIPK